MSGQGTVITLELWLISINEDGFGLRFGFLYYADFSTGLDSD